VTLHSEIFQQRWNHYGYWFRESETGLFRLNSLGRVTLTILTFQGKVDLSSTMKFDVGIQFAFDKIQDDSLKKKDPHVPYLEKLRLPFNFEYQIDETTQARLSFVWVGARNIYLTDDRKLAEFGLLSAKVEKQFRKNISLYLKGNNLLNQKYQIWQGYPTVKFYFEVGMKANW
jgi:outer membrane cobalamin receptor